MPGLDLADVRAEMLLTVGKMNDDVGRVTERMYSLERQVQEAGARMSEMDRRIGVVEGLLSRTE